MKYPKTGIINRKIHTKLESVHNVDTLWTDYLKNRIFAACEPKVRWRENAMSVYKVTDFVDRH